MPRLVLINGLPASGKSTIARLYADAHPLALALDVDVVRSMLGCWLEQSGPSGLAARRLAVEMARAHLRAGHDVLVPQFLGDPAFIVTLEALATELEMPFIEVVLLTTAAESAARFDRRSAHPGRPEHVDASRQLDQSGGPGQLALMHARLADVVRSRPRTRPVRTVDGAVDTAYRDFINAIDGAGP